MAQTLARRWPTVLLVLWLPLVKWSLPPGVLRLLLFFGGGSALGALAVWREGDCARVWALFRSPLSGLLRGLYGYAMLVAIAAVLLYLPLIQPLMPYALYDLAALFDPIPVYLAFAQGDALPSVGTLAAVALGSAVEEWIFRTVLFWRWLPAPDAGGAPRAVPRPAALWRLAVVSVYFAALHWPQPPGAMGIALLGGFVVGLVLLWQRSYVSVAVLHILFNWRLLF